MSDTESSSSGSGSTSYDEDDRQATLERLRALKGKTKVGNRRVNPKGAKNINPVKSDEEGDPSKKKKKKGDGEEEEEEKGFDCGYWCCTVFWIIFFLLTLMMKIQEEQIDLQERGYVDYYEVLGVSRSAKLNDIKRAYRRLAVKWHPDKNPDCEECTEKFAVINKAYQTLIDPDKRAYYSHYKSDAPAGYQNKREWSTE
eukprot:GFYU01002335.1.p1 GENE.GFYU01002335.1~~GFYU01002335.1.p1  ORF type:complete len:199 (-),score=52.28 GFYU01002335.1:128-724(-)